MENNPYPNTAIETEDVWRVYKTGSLEVAALKGVNLQIAQGTFAALKGRSGSGKTTLLNCIGGLDSPTDGKIRIFGEEIHSWSERQLTRWRREQVGFIFQSFGLLPSLSAFENVELILRMSGVKGRERHDKTVNCLDLVGLTRWMHHRPFELSGGQQQRVAIARSLANDPKLILADEPTGELDSTTAREILSLFQQIVREQNVTFLIVTHDSLVDDYVDYVLYLKDGQIDIEGLGNGHGPAAAAAPEVVGAAGPVASG
ncbi:MAG: ABC transporter ATP-binding protein [Caldilineaceae bacterium]|nr:ABC transporter ATP-binding protein [Caldilineaceae bacterium]MCY3993172.1 ABC transporter ATP-binding protein [Caldilineaceae bacterium]MDE0079930.1 ABC transporter ATP-binding protein [Caldilineaceae bacterium]